MRRLLLSAALVATLCACGKSDGVAAEDAWIRLPAVAGRPGAAYFEVEANGRGDALVGISTPVAKRAELHESMAGDGGMMTMAPLAEVALKAGEEVAFVPGGRHAMLFDMTPDLQAGSETKVTLTFASGREIVVPARIVGAGETPPE